jgi:hypothetical protein
MMLFVTALVTAASAAPDTTWPQFRGHGGRATSDITTLPTTWSTTINVARKIDVPGRAWSSPTTTRARVGGIVEHLASIRTADHK